MTTFSKPWYFMKAQTWQDVLVGYRHTFTSCHPGQFKHYVISTNMKNV